MCQQSPCASKQVYHSVALPFGEAAYLRQEALFLFCSKEEANHPEELQVGCGHLDLLQGAVEEVHGQIEGLSLKLHHLLASNKQCIQDQNDSQ